MCLYTLESTLHWHDGHREKGLWHYLYLCHIGPLFMPHFVSALWAHHPVARRASEHRDMPPRLKLTSTFIMRADHNRLQPAFEECISKMNFIQYDFQGSLTIVSSQCIWNKSLRIQPSLSLLILYIVYIQYMLSIIIYFWIHNFACFSSSHCFVSLNKSWVSEYDMRIWRVRVRFS